jgi:anti-sigma factor RsiW
MARLECVNPVELKAFLLGDLPEPLSDSIARHLETCPDCETAVGRLDAAIDPPT